MTLLIVLVVVLVLFGGFSYGPGPWRGGGPTPGYAPYGLGGIFLIIILLVVLGVIRI